MIYSHAQNLPTLVQLLNMLTHSLTGQSFRALCSPSSDAEKVKEVHKI